SGEDQVAAESRGEAYAIGCDRPGCRRYDASTQLTLVILGGGGRVLNRHPGRAIWYATDPALRALRGSSSARNKPRNRKERKVEFVERARRRAGGRLTLLRASSLAAGALARRKPVARV